MKMKSSERYELIKQGLSEGKTKSQIARWMGVTPALISQIVKKHGNVLNQISEIGQQIEQGATASMPE